MRHIHNLWSARLGVELIERLAAIHPSDNNFTYRCDIAEDDARWSQLCQALADAGLRPTRDAVGPDQPGLYETWPWRRYEASDLERCEYVRLNTRLWLRTSDYQSGSDPVVLESDELPALEGGDFCISEDLVWLAADRVRAAWEPAGLMGAVFRDVLLLDPRSAEAREWPEPGRRWWHLAVKADLPVPLPRGADDEPFADTDHRFRRSDLAAVGPFDIGRVGRPGGFPFSEYPLIVSRRCYDVCVAHGLRAEYAPVRIVDS